MPRRRKTSDLRFPTMINTVSSALIGFIIIFILVLLFAYVVTKIDATDTIISIMTSVALCVGAYTGGYISAKKRRRNGLFMGVVCGIFMFFVIVVISTFFAQKMAGFSGTTKFVLTLIFSAVGGIVGVNSKNRRF